ncbi:MAG: hypothetical protein AB8G05_21985 [Oligoflexales bacterium]
MKPRLMLIAGIFCISLTIFYLSKSPGPEVINEPILRPTHDSKHRINNGVNSLLNETVPINNEPQQKELETGLSAEEVKIIRLIKARFSSGDYQTSLRLLETHLEETNGSESFLEWMQKQLQAVLTASAWMKIKTGDCEGALSDFDRARVFGKDRAISSGLAYCYHQLRLWDDARSEIQWYLEREPLDISAMNLYADILESSRNYEQAVLVLEKAIEHSKKDKEKEMLKRKLSAMKKKEGESYFQELSQSRHFSLLFHGEVSNNVADWILSTLEKAHEELIDRWSMKPLRGPVEVVVYSQETFSEIMVGGPHWLGGVFDGRIRLPLLYQGFTEQQFWENLETTLRHELVHAMFADMTRRRPLPPWFEEGVAQRFTCEGVGCNVLDDLPTPGSFLLGRDFTQSFTQYGMEKAGIIYKQSLYLILCLEQLVDTGGLRGVIEQISHQGPLDSDSILKPIGSNFATLLSTGRKKWEEGVALYGNGR